MGDIPRRKLVTIIIETPDLDDLEKHPYVWDQLSEEIKTQIIEQLYNQARTETQIYWRDYLANWERACQKEATLNEVAKLRAERKNGGNKDDIQGE